MDAATPAVVDTDVVSFLFKTHALAAAYQTIPAGRSLAVSLITLAEIEDGMEAKNWGATRRDLMRRFLAALRFYCRTLRRHESGRGSRVAVTGKAGPSHSPMPGSRPHSFHAVLYRDRSGPYEILASIDPLKREEFKLEGRAVEGLARRRRAAISPG
jgi:hypothetical protein